MDARRRFGNQGEAIAAAFLQNLGYQILTRQYRTKGGEIDLICQDGNEIVFVEVKTRRSSLFGFPEMSVTPSKIGRMIKASDQYMSVAFSEEVPWRFDVVSVCYEIEPPKIDHFIGIDIPEQFW